MGDFGVESIAFSPDGHRIVVADSSDWAARIWDAETGAPVTLPLRHRGPVYFAAFSHDGRFVVTTSEDKTARVWDATTGQPITPPLKHNGTVDHAMFTADDSGVKTVGREEKQGFVRHWSLTPDQRPTKELLRLAQELSLQRLDGGGALVPLDFETMKNTPLLLHR